ncbi:MAG: hypothetical protein K6G30_03770, partial [Acetatifactor sp.]|nr:hypothetical protein [Acetatifactor sp.]
MENTANQNSKELLNAVVLKQQPFKICCWSTLLVVKALFEVWILVSVIKSIIMVLLDGSRRNITMFYKEYALCMLVYTTVFALTKGIEFHISRCGNQAAESALLKHLFSLETWDVGFDSGGTMAKIRVDIPKIITTRVTLIAMLIDLGVCICVGSIYAISLNRIVYVSCIIVVGIAYFLTYNSHKKMPDIEKKAGDLFNRNYTNVWEIVENTEVVQFLNKNNVLKDFKETAEENVKNAVSKGKSYANVNISKKIINVGLVYLVCVVGACATYGNDNLAENIADITALVILIPKIANALVKTYDWSLLLKEYQGMCKRLDDLMLRKKYSSAMKEEKISDINTIAVRN